jgi:hypothetical protein
VFLISIIVGTILTPISLPLAFKMDYSSGPMAVAITITTFLLFWLIKK